MCERRGFLSERMGFLFEREDFLCERETNCKKNRDLKIEFDR
jgi:hypothetical protein